MRETSIDFMGKRKVFAAASIVFVLLALGDIIFQGLNLGLDFTGGTLVEVQFPEPAQPSEVRQYLEQAGFEGGTVQFFGSERDLLVRMPVQEDEQQAKGLGAVGQG